MPKNVKRWFHVVVIFVIILSLFAIAIMADTGRYQALNEKVVTDDLRQLKIRIDSNIGQFIKSSEGLIAFIKTHYDPTRGRMDVFMSELYDLEDPIFKNAAIIKGSTIVYQYPWQGNESSIGVDLLQIEAQKASIIEAITTLEPTINGPVDLVQGGRGLIMRMPVLANDQPFDTYWGMVSLVLDYEALIKDLLKGGFDEVYHVYIEKTDPGGDNREVVYGEASHLDDSSQSNKVLIQTDIWTLTLTPVEKPKFLSNLGQVLLLVGLMMAILMGFIDYRQLQINDHLNELVDVRTKELSETNASLEQYVAEYQEKQAELTLVNNQLEASMVELKQTQDQLILTEKLSAMGEMVASLAHEINTPLGVCVTLYSFVEEQMKQVLQDIHSGQDLVKEDLETTVSESQEALILMGTNLKRASELVSSFKLVTMDQYLEEYRIINLSEYMEEILNSIRPKHKNILSITTLNIDPSIRLYTYPGAISQVITNLINNSMTHGFEMIDDKRIEISATFTKKATIRLLYSDNGIGFNDEVLKQIYTPFFTTKKNKGSTGLGMHIVYNAIVKTLGGQITILKHTEGFQIEMIIPIKVTQA